MLLQAREWYNEPDVGRAILASSVNRSSLFLTSKLHPRHFDQVQLSEGASVWLEQQ